MRERELAAVRPRDGVRRPAVNVLMERATGGRSTARARSTLERLCRSADD